MTNTINTTAEVKMTQAAALRWLIDHAVDCPEDVREAAEKLYTAKTKKYNTTKTVSKARRENEVLADEVEKYLFDNQANDRINSAYLAGEYGVGKITTPQKANAVMAILIERGTAEKFTVKGRTYYRITEDGISKVA